MNHSTKAPNFIFSFIRMHQTIRYPEAQRCDHLIYFWHLQPPPSQPHEVQQGVSPQQPHPPASAGGWQHLQSEQRLLSSGQQRHDSSQAQVLLAQPLGMIDIDDDGVLI
eukprot:806315_1